MGKNKNAFILIVSGVILFHFIGISWLGKAHDEHIDKPIEKKIVVKTVVLSKPKKIVKQAPKPQTKKVEKPLAKKKEENKKNSALVGKAQEILSKLTRINTEIKTAKTIDKLLVESSNKTTQYHEIVGSKLKLSLRLPEKGAVKVHLTLSRLGKVLKVEIVSNESELNREYIRKELPKLIFPNFGSYLKEEKHTFIVTLQSEIKL